MMTALSESISPIFHRRMPAERHYAFAQSLAIASTPVVSTRDRFHPVTVQMAGDVISLLSMNLYLWSTANLFSPERTSIVIAPDDVRTALAAIVSEHLFVAVSQ